MHGVEDDIERQRSVILASEGWGKQYAKSPATHAKLIRTTSRLDRKLRGYFKDLSLKAPQLVDWSAYNKAVQAFNVNTIINSDIMDQSTSDFVNVVLQDITLATALGAQSGEDIYKIVLGLNTASATIQDIALNHVAELVGMRVTNDGRLVPSANATMNIMETTRQDIRSSITTSLALGENISDAADRLAGILDNPDRAEVIARTETVNSFGGGLLQYGRESGAVGKEWQDVDAIDVCADNSDAGPVELDDSFPSGDDAPAAHPNCRCSMRLIYQNELNDNPDLFSDD